MNKYESINIGDKAELKHVITLADIEKFVDLTGDDNKLHVDKQYASQTLFKTPVVHGMLGASFISTIIGTKLPGDGALWFSQNLEFILPVRVGDEITVTAEVKKKYDRDNTIEIQTDIFNQHKQKVTSGFAKVKIIPQEKSPETKEQSIAKKVALVVGGTGGIGSATCMALAKKGFSVVIHYHSNKEFAIALKDEITKQGLEAIVLQADILDEQQVIAMMNQVERKFGTLTALVNCTTTKIANIKFSSMEWQDIESHINMQLKGCFHLAKHVLPMMEKNKYGKIVNITTQAIETPNAEWLHYITAKSALNGFSKSLAIEMAPKGIRVNMVSPSMTTTTLISEIPEKVRLITEARTPLNRLSNPSDVAEAICYLVCPESDFITGETIRVNGGQVML